MVAQEFATVQIEKGVYIPLNEREKTTIYTIFLEILGTVESPLCQLATLIRNFLPVRLTNHKADSTLSISILLLFKISPSNLDRRTATPVVCYGPVKR